MSAFKINLADIDFILRQIKISEAHANGTALTAIWVDAAGNVVPQGTLGAIPAIPDPHVPYGLRTVDGRDNNIIPGRENWGAADTPMPRLLDGSAANDGDGDSFDPDGPGPAPAITNGNYAGSGSVADADPRTISNLVVDMSANNPAALFAALVFAGSEDPQADLEALLALRLTPAQAAAAVAAAQSAVNAANEALDDAVEAYSTATTKTPVLIDAIQTAAQALTVAETGLTQAQATAANPAAALKAKAESFGLVFDDTNSLVIPNVSADEGLTAPFNAWMTFFGQFFDHGLDLITKGGEGTIYIPLQPDDPLYVPGGRTNFMVLTRATQDENGAHTNTTTSWVDQNQTYTSHSSHQVFLREYEVRDGKPVATGKLLDGKGPNGEKNGLPTWADVKAQALMLGIQLTDQDVTNVPLLRTDAYGNFIPNAAGYAQVITGIGADGIPNTADDIVISGTPTAPVSLTTAVRTGHAFLDDIAHNAVPGFVDHDRNPGTPMIAITADTDTVAGNAIAPNAFGQRVEYDDELLNAHYITGDGRGNENIGLTAVHHIFHSEHNRQIEQQKITILTDGDLAFVNQWLYSVNPTGPATPLTQAQLTAIKAGFAAAVNKSAYLASLEDADITGTGVTGVKLSWDGERLFQAGRFATEMQYQHLVFEEFARKVQPAIDVFVFNNITDVDPTIFSEFANVVYRFGHSMLTDSMPRIHLNADGSIAATDDMGLIASFLNPLEFEDRNGQNTTGGLITAEQAAGAIVRGMTIERGNEIDEFITNSLRNSLLGLPLDLAAINIARGRDTNMPTLNHAREQLFAASGSSFLTPYDSWADFAANLKNPISVVNFIAAYGRHESILSATTTAAKRDAAWALVFGGDDAPADRLDYVNSTGAWNAGNSGLNEIDLWIGGLAEKKMPFGGMLGSTFNAVFELQLENLQDGDRFYYLTRTQGQNMLVMLEQNSFAKLIMANTDIALPGPDGLRGTSDDIVTRHIGVDSFAAYDFVLEVNAANQADYNGAAAGKDPLGQNAALEAMGLGKVARDNPGTSGPDANYLRFTGGEHVVAGGTNEADTIITDFGDDGIWGDGGNDRIESGAGVDLVNGGAGDDIITDSGDTGDFLKGDEGDDVIANSNGIDIIMGGTGNDAIFVGVDDTEVFAGEGNDFVLGGDGVDLLMGNEGDDWIEGGGGFDTIAGDNSELFFDSKIIGHDVMFSGNEEQDFDAESGDDIMVQGESVIRNEGMFGFDWAIYKDMQLAADADLRTPIFTTEQEDILRNRFDKVEALSGWDKNDILRGDDRTFDPTLGPDAINANTENVFFNDALDAAGLARITGLNQIVTLDPTTNTYEHGNILLGGKGSDILQGNGGDDIIDGDRWLNVRIRISTAPGGADQLTTVDSLKHVFTDADFPPLPVGQHHPWVGKSLFELMISRTIVPSQLHIVREIINDADASAVDIAVFNDVLANYTITANPDGSFTVTQNAVTPGGIDPVTGNNLVSDGVDTVRNIEILRFADQDISLVRPEVQLNAFNTQDFRDNFTNAAFNNTQGNTPWTTAWVETNDGTNTVGGGQIQTSAGALRFVGSVTATVSNGAEITRDINLAGASSATISFTADPAGLDAGENVRFEFAANGSDFLPLAEVVGNGGVQTYTFEVAGPFSATAKVRFVGTSMNAGEGVVIDNLSITPYIPDPAGTTNYETTFTENGTAVAIADGPSVEDDSGTIENAQIVLTNAQAGDALSVVGTLPVDISFGVDTTIAGQITLFLIGPSSELNFQAAIRAVRFSNNSENPSTVDRTINVTVNDGFLTSAVATTIVNVNATNDAPVGNADSIFTNIVGTPVVVPSWALLANDVDPDGPALSISAVNNAVSLTGLSLVSGGASVTFTDPAAGGAGGSFNYAVTDGALSDNTNGVTVTRQATTLTGNANNNILVGGATGTAFDGAGGNDIIFAGGGNDTITWNVGGGRDFVDGGTETDTFIVNGNNAVETFIVYTKAAAALDGIVTNRPETEIVITRNGVVIAELVEIQEITINTAGGADTVIPRGDFSTTTLNVNTITINGSPADDTVDISGLTSVHRIVFRSNGGNDTVVGTLRSQDVIELPAGADPADYNLVENSDGTKSYKSDTHEIKFSGDAPQLHQSDDEDEEEDDEDCNNNEDDDDGDNSGPSGNDDDEEEDEDEDEDDSDEDGETDEEDEDDDDSDEDGEDDSDSDDDDSDGDSDDDDDDDSDDDDGQTPAPGQSGGGNSLPFVVYLGVAGGTAVGRLGNDILSGSEHADAFFGLEGDDSIIGNGGDDNIVAGDGHDTVFAGSGNDKVLAGAGNDVVFGDEGNDTIWGDAGNDRITAGAGDDVVDAGDGNDVIYATAGDGNDVYVGGIGTDTIDFQAITSALTINLGSSGAGSATSTQSGTDVLDGIENVKGGSGNDVIFASNAVNVLDGGAGNDTFVFNSVAAANGDRIEGFTTGDKIDLTPIFSQGETVVASDATFNLAGQIRLIFVNDDTRVEGNTDSNADVDFSFIVAGKHLTGTDFT